LSPLEINIFAAGPSGLAVRLLPLARVLEDYGTKCKIISPIAWNSIIGDKLGRISYYALTHPPKAYIETMKKAPNIVIISNTSTPQIYLFQKILKSKRIKVIFDLYDAIFLPVSRLFGSHIRPGSFYLERIVRDADFVTVNGHYLLEYAKSWNERVAIIHDPIDIRIIGPKYGKNSSKVTIGWEGDARVHHENLNMLVRPLERIGKKYDVRFKLVSSLGDPKVKQMFRKLESLIEIDYGPDHWLPFKEFVKLLLDIDIMVAPLRKNPWYEGKSALRVGIGMAMGLPVVASPVGEQKYVIKHGINGFIAKNEDEWYEYLKLLVEDDKLRKIMGKKGRKTAERELSLEVNGKKLYKIIKTVAES